MELSDYTVDELKAELKRRSEAARLARASVGRCRNCKHLLVEEQKSIWWVCYKCGARSYKMRGKEHHYIVNLSQRACSLYEKKEV